MKGEVMNVLLLGGTGRTGGRVLQQLLGRGVRVRAVVRSAERLPAGVVDDPIARTLPLWIRSESAESVSSMSVEGSSRWTW